MISKIQAIQSLVPGAEVSVAVHDDSVTWIMPENPPITDEQIAAEQQRLQMIHDWHEYRRNRAAEYPTIQEQLDALYHAGVFPPAMAARIQAVKANNRAARGLGLFNVQQVLFRNLLEHVHDVCHFLNSMEFYGISLARSAAPKAPTSWGSSGTRTFLPSVSARKRRIQGFLATPPVKTISPTEDTRLIMPAAR